MWIYSPDSFVVQKGSIMVKLFFILLCIFTTELNSQVLAPDSTRTKKDSVNNNFYNSNVNPNLNFTPEGNYRINRFSTLNHLYLLSNDSLFNKLSYSYYNEQLPRANIYRASRNLYNNTKEMKNYFRNFYLQSKPSAFQKVLGAVDFSGAIILAGYHVWKTYIKKSHK